MRQGHGLGMGLRYIGHLNARQCLKSSLKDVQRVRCLLLFTHLHNLDWYTYSY